jgi:methylthioribose-1-phosphate isomerase
LPSVVTPGHVEPIRWDGEHLLLLDQRMLPRQMVYLSYDDPHAVADAIRTMVVRGAPAIGVTAAFGMALAARNTTDPVASVHAAAEILGRARPTAVNLRWAIRRMLTRLDAAAAGGSRTIYDSLVFEAKVIFAEDVAANRRIGAFGQELIESGSTILTHCNAGALATAGYGTALGIVRAVSEAGKKIAVFADETRPYLQGARLTAWELQQDGIDVTLITDNMAGHFFQKDTFDAVIVGADRIAANGDVANKIGTYTVAVLASAHSVPFYVAAPISTIDPGCPDGNSIPIEERSGSEVTEAAGWSADGAFHTIGMAPIGIAVRHPAFDVTPAALVTAIVTDRGVLRSPYSESIARLLATYPEHTAAKA